MTEQTMIDWVGLVAPALVALLCFGGALAISNVVVLNKGAKANLAWTLFAFALLCFGIAEGDRLLVALDLPNVSAARDALKILGAGSAFGAALYGRSLFKGLLK
ncbi:MAG TPA: hypothetical protein VJ694_00900 [Patescibacteria group bacterium]|nr:hypothetical protein [Patescibacteria group bacterium]